MTISRSLDVPLAALVVRHTHPNGEHMTAQEIRDHMVTQHGESPLRLHDKHLAELVYHHLTLAHGSPQSDAVDHPSHYGGADNPYEAIKVIEAWLGPVGVSAFCIGNAMKYVSRAGKKDPTKTVEDLKKARWYLNYEIERIERGSSDATNT